MDAIIKKFLKDSFNKDHHLNIPTSKSLAHRAIIAAAFSEGKSIIKNITFSDDINATISSLINIGAKIKKINNDLEIEGIKEITIKDNNLYVKESGSTLRFLIPFCTLTKEELNFHLEGNLKNRPLDIYKQLFLENKNNIFELNDNILKVKGTLPNNITIKGNISSQFITGLLLLMPINNNISTITVLKPIESKSYIDLTCEVMEKFNIKLIINETENEVVYKIDKNNSKYQSTIYEVEKDCSQMAFFFTFAKIHNLNINLNSSICLKSKQGDRKIIDFLDIIDNNDMPIISLKDTPDLGPILFAYAFIKNKKVIFTDTKRLKIKESDRALAMKEELDKIYPSIIVNENEVIILKKDTNYLNNITEQLVFDSHKDHRIAMSMAIVATKICENAKIINSECINKSYPNFFLDLQELGVEIKYE